jgi:D-threonate/D-erythronate kinase
MLAPSALGILADDLTGACDVAACFVAVAGPVAVSISPETFTGEGRGLAVVNTASRAMSAEESRAVVRSVGLRLAGKRVIFKKVCSALRGKVGAELEGLLDAVGTRKVIIAPAIPKIGRTTRAGVQYDGGVPIHQTAYALDPVSPIRSGNILEIVAESGRVECRVGDAETEDDLREIVAEALENPRVVFVGSLGLAHALAEQLEPARHEADDGPIPGAGHLLLLSGSPYPRAQEQVEWAASHYGERAVALNSVAEANGLREWPRGVIALIVRTTGGLSARPSETLSRFIEAAADLVERLKPEGLAVMGGETALQFLKRLQVTRLTVRDQMDEVISCGTIADGAPAGRPFAMKGGSVGPKDAAIHMIEFLKKGTTGKA